MKVLLLNIDSKLPNIALKKIEMYHKDDEVIWDMPMMLNQVDKAYASCIFTRNKSRVDNLLGLRPDLAFLFATIKVPKPVRVNLSPFFNAFVTLLVKEFNAFSAAAFVILASLEIFAMSSAFVIPFHLLFL